MYENSVIRNVMMAHRRSSDDGLEFGLDKSDVTSVCVLWLFTYHSYNELKKIHNKTGL